MSDVEQKHPLISVILPVYNVEKYLHAAMDSVISQSYHNFEIIAVDDGSTDRSGDILDVYAKSDSRVSVYHRSNHGLSATRNFGFSKASGEYLYFLDSDDVICPGLLEFIAASSKEKTVDIIYLSGDLIDKHGKKILKKPTKIRPDISEPVKGDQLFADLFSTYNYSTLIIAFVFNKSYLIDKELRFDEGYIHEDEAFAAEALCMAENVVSTSSCYYLHRIRPHSIMKTTATLENVEGWTKAISRLVDFMDTSHINAKAKKAILERSKSLLNNTLVLIRRINKKNGNSVTIFDYLKRHEIHQLGLAMVIKSKFPTLVVLQRHIRSKETVMDLLNRI